MISIIARYRACAGAETDVSRALVEYAPIVRAEPGCLSFEVYRSVDEPAEFIVHEQYRGPAEAEAHTSSEHYATIARDRIRPLLAERQVARYQRLEP
jgi:quinol monooxygenase YgiN